MIVDINLPVIGDNIPSADVVKVNVKEGDSIKVNDVIIEIETDKATVEVPSEIDGIVKKVFVQEGTKAKVGEPIVSIETEVQQESLTKEKIINKEPKSEIKPEEVKPIQPVEVKKEKEHTHMPQLVSIPRDISKTVAPAAPSVRRFAREIGIDINNVRGSGNHGRITIDDVKAYAKNLNQKLESGNIIGSGVTIAKETLPDFSKWGEIEIQPMSNVRRKTAEHLSFAWATIPHVTQFDKADITDLEELRKKFSKQVENAGGKLTITAILLKVVASAMQVFPQFNSSIDMEKNEIIYKKYFNIGVAVDTEKGLLVPVIRDVNKKNVTQLSIDLAEISKKAREKKLSLDDMQGGCFTISNLGGIGGTYFTPIVNSPEVAILGVSKSKFEPVYINGEFKPRLIMPLSLSYDHRIIDGADAIRFLRWVINALENPFLLVL